MSEIEPSLSDAGERRQTARILARDLWRPRALAGAGAPVVMAVVGFVGYDETLLWASAVGLVLVQAVIGLLYVVDVRRFGG